VTPEEVSQLQTQGPALAATAQARLSSIEGQPLNIYGTRLDLARITEQINLHFNEFLLGQFGNALSLGLAALGTMLQIVLMLIVGFLLAMDAHRVTHLLRSLTPTAYRADFDIVWERVKSMLYSYMRGQLIIATLIGIFSGVAVQLLGIKYAIALGLLAAITTKTAAVFAALGIAAGGGGAVAATVATGSSNPVVWEQQVQAAVSQCKTELSPGERGVGHCVSHVVTAQQDLLPSPTPTAQSSDMVIGGSVAAPTPKPAAKAAPTPTPKPRSTGGHDVDGDRGSMFLGPDGYTWNSPAPISPAPTR